MEAKYGEVPLTKLSPEMHARWAGEAGEIASRYPEEVRQFVFNLVLESRMIGACGGKRSAFKHVTYQDMMLEHATPRLEPLALPDWCPEMEKQQCYANSYLLAISDPTLTYVEGYALHSYFTVSHAWVEDRDGRIIDPTWVGLNGEVTHAYYLGMRFDTEFLECRSEETGWISFFANDWLRDAECLRLGFVMDGDLAIGMGEL